MTPVKVGDRVKVVRGFNEGAEGTVIDVTLGQGQMWQCRVRRDKAGPTDKMGYRFDELAVLPPESDAEGRKDDAGKAPYDLLAPEFLSGTAEILAFGAAKYAPRNWEKGMAWSRPFAAMMRHMWAWWAGEQTDPETGKSHLWHAACCVMFLVAYEQRRTGTDDRPNSA